MKSVILTVSCILLALSSNVYAGGAQGDGNFKMGNFTSDVTVDNITQDNITQPSLGLINSDLSPSYYQERNAQKGGCVGIINNTEATVGCNSNANNGMVNH
ncbi:MAG: hypothetical protein WAX77_02570 [Methylococcaceae bacterium]